MKTIYRIIIILSLTGFGMFKIFSQSGWLSQTSGVTDHLLDIQFVNGDLGYASGKNGVFLKTINGGIYWSFISGFTNNDIVKLYFHDANTGWIISTGAFPQGTDIFKTTNGGINFSNQFHDSSIPSELDLFFTDLNNGWICSPNMLVHTTNGGTNWNQLIQPQGSQIYFLNTNTGFLLNNFEQYKTINNGLNWTMTSNSLIHLKYVNFYNAATGYALGRNQTFFKTVNGGNNWNSYSIVNNVNYYFYSAYFNDINTGWAVSYATDSGRGLVFKTINGGTNWYQQYVGTNQEIRAIYFIDMNTGWLIGYNGIIFKTTNGGGEPIGIQQTGSEIPSSISMSQNFPNPFNPETSLEFEISNSTNVKISIFDLTGRELTTLVNNTINPGKYRTNWNAAGYPSGVYLCRIESSEFTQTKKMILIK